ncbi:hypothetical protein BJP36_21825 [Moorena producens JHB]|uniref:Uncharacterized protein n=1 Tax=Moorena producens (strain JHB) TaxID=1454205 RepID=A0A1D9G426_MOOP1|nr:hypothetical protein [Moorena producens]AOY82150.1 hypothetical protein BJP36_21825 [Moorena producens JHB]
MQEIFKTSKRSVVSGQWSVVSGQWSAVSGQPSAVSRELKAHYANSRQLILFKSTSKWHRLPACDLTHKLITNS